MQQEKQKLSNDLAKQQKMQDELSSKFETLQNKYQTTLNDKMLMKLEKDRLIAKVENLELSMNQPSDENIDASLQKSKHETSAALGQSSTKAGAAQAQ